MLNTLRTYRSLATLLAGILFLASALPLIEHACALAGLPGISTIRRCCCDERHDAHSGMAMPGTPCPEGETAHSSAQAALGSGDCCSVEVQSSGVKAMLRAEAPLLPLVATALLVLPKSLIPEAAPPRPISLQDTGPPLLAHVSLQILYASFLN